MGRAKKLSLRTSPTAARSMRSTSYRRYVKSFAGFNVADLSALMRSFTFGLPADPGIPAWIRRWSVAPPGGSQDCPTSIQQAAAAFAFHNELERAICGTRGRRNTTYLVASDYWNRSTHNSPPDPSGPPCAPTMNGSDASGMVRARPRSSLGCSATTLHLDVRVFSFQESRLAANSRK